MMKTNHISLYLVSVLLCCQSLNAQFTFQHWAYSDIIRDAGEIQIVNIDGDEIVDRLYTEIVDGVVIAAGWESRNSESIGYTHSIELPDFPVSVVGVIDIDQDSDGDLLFIHEETGLIYVSEQYCDAEFKTAIRLESSTGSYAGFKIHDMNGDGIEDIIGFSKTAFSTHIMELGLGNGLYGSVQSLFIGYTNIFTRRYQDMNGDGITDITIASGGASRILYYPGQVTGGWGSEVLIRSISNARGSAIGDIDGDGLPDMVAAQFTGNANTIRLSRNLGNDEYELISIITGEIATFSISCADVNNDGLDDILISNLNGFGCNLYVNKGNYNFDKKEIYDDGNARATFSDVNSNGNLDIVITEVGNDVGDETFWLKGNGSGGFTELSELYPIIKASPSFQLYDLTKDGITDKITYVTFFDKGFFWLQEGIGNGQFQERELLLTTSAIDPREWNIANMDGDNNIDLIYIEDEDLIISSSTSNGKFTAPKVFHIEIDNFIILNDNCDQYSDLVLVDKSRDNSYWAVNTAEGLELILLYEGDGLRLFSEDIELDGYTDVLIDSRSSGSHKVVVVNNTMDGMKVSSINDVDIIAGQSLLNIQAIDYNLDGEADIFYNTSNIFKWLQGREDGTYEAEQDYDEPNASFSYSTIYIPEEGKRVFWNKRDDYSYLTVIAPETFSSKKYFIPGYDAPIYQQADIDNDGKIDMFTRPIDKTIGWMTSAGTSNYGLAIIKRPCSGDAGGIVRITTRCNEDILITWSDGYVGAERMNLTSGIYSYSITVDNEIVYHNEFELRNSEVTEYSIQTKADNGNNNGAFRIITTNGTQPINLSWTNSLGQSGTKSNGLSAGTYTVEISFSEDCIVEDTFIIPVTVGTEESELDNVKLVPTIAKDYTSIFGRSSGNLQYQIYSQNGILAISGKTENSNNEIDISELPIGIYFCKIYNNHEFSTIRFIKVE